MGDSCTEIANSAEVSFGQECHGHDSARPNAGFYGHTTKDDGRHAAKGIDLQARAGKKRVPTNFALASNGGVDAPFLASC